MRTPIRPNGTPQGFGHSINTVTEIQPPPAHPFQEFLAMGLFKNLKVGWHIRGLLSLSVPEYSSFTVFWHNIHPYGHLISSNVTKVHLFISTSIILTILVHDFWEIIHGVLTITRISPYYQNQSILTYGPMQ